MPTIGRSGRVQPPLYKRLVAEALGTYGLVFAGTPRSSSIAAGRCRTSALPITFGLVVFALIAALATSRGAPESRRHARLLLRTAIPAKAPRYIGSQLAGACSPASPCGCCFPQAAMLGAQTAGWPRYQSWVLEMLLTARLMFVILSVSTGSKEKGITAGVAVGAVIALEALFAGPISGASMNPARSLAPALVSGSWRRLWVYLTAPRWAPARRPGLPVRARAGLLRGRCAGKRDMSREDARPLRLRRELQPQPDGRGVRPDARRRGGRGVQRRLAALGRVTRRPSRPCRSSATT